MPAAFWIVVVLVVGSVTDTALAWGPATHVGLGDTVLRNLGLVPTAIAAMLSRHAVAYLYGNIAADIVFAKRLSRVKQYCHHWSTAFEVLRSAPTDKTKAFAYGYLSHLAADTVAHGKFVPQLVTMSGAAINTGHLYWELRADSSQSHHSWGALRNILSDDHEEHHDVLSEHLSASLLSYSTNRFLFNRLNALSLNRGFRRSMSFVDRWSRWDLPGPLLQGYHSESVDRIISVLSEGEESPVLLEDPSGTQTLRKLRDQRRTQRQLRVPGRRLINGAEVIRRPASASRGIDTTKSTN